MKVKRPDFSNSGTTKHKPAIVLASKKSNGSDHFSWGLLPGSFDPVFPEQDGAEAKKNG